MKRQIIHIDEDKCTGCEQCIINCPEGALAIVDGVARLVSDIQCDGLGACIGHCPEDAITIEVREAEAYDERKVIETMIPQGQSVLQAHLDHLRDHDQKAELAEAHAVLKEHGIDLSEPKEKPKAKILGHGHALHPGGGGCPGSKAFSFAPKPGIQPAASDDAAPGGQPSQLAQWPIQLHLVSPAAPYFRNSHLVLSADCVAHSVGDYHQRFLKGNSLAIACPKLDQGKEIYLNKLVSLVDDAQIQTLTVLTMEVPCCSGLFRMARQAVETASRDIPMRLVVVGVRGDVLTDEWLPVGNEKKQASSAE